MRRCVIADRVLGQSIPTTSASEQLQLCCTLTYSRSRPEADVERKKANGSSWPGAAPQEIIRRGASNTVIQNLLAMRMIDLSSYLPL